MALQAKRATRRGILVLGLLLHLYARLDAADVLLYSIVKSQGWQQTGPAETARSAGDKFVFQAGIIETAPGRVGTASVQLPVTSIERPLSRENASSYDLSYANSSPPTGGPEITTTAGFDAAYPNGTYLLRVSTANDGTRLVSANLMGDTYPTVPQISNFSDAQQIDPENPFTLSWFPFVGGTTSDFIHVRVVDDTSTLYASGLPGAANALNGTSTGATIPSGLLQPGQTYRLTLFFAKAVSIDRTSYPGATGYIGYGQTLYTTVRTVPAPTAPSILGQPQSVSASPGETVVFSVEATGTPPLFFQWYLNGAVIPGANSSSFSIPSAQFSDSGSYSVAVSNALETVFSEPAQLSITSPGSLNGVLALDGAGDYLSIPSSPDLQNATNFSLECWLYPRNSQNSFASIINKGDGLSGASARSYELRWTADERITASLFFRSTAEQPDFISLSAPVPSNRWTHVAVTFDSQTGTARLLTNGVVAVEWQEAGLTLEGREIRQTTLPLVLGWAPTHAGTYMSGWLDEVRVWSRARASHEIRAEMACKLSGQELNLAGYWNFDTLSADDQTGKGHEETLAGDAMVIERTTADMDLFGCDPARFVYSDGEPESLQWYLRGRIGGTYLIQSSTNMANWTDYGPLEEDRPVFQFRTTANEPKSFYRAVLQP